MDIVLSPVAEVICVSFVVLFFSVFIVWMIVDMIWTIGLIKNKVFRRLGLKDCKKDGSC